jgi:hypothetical protein
MKYKNEIEINKNEKKEIEKAHKVLKTIVDIYLKCSFT